MWKTVGTPCVPKYYGEVAQKLLLLGDFRAAAVVLDWMDQEVAKLDH